MSTQLKQFIIDTLRVLDGTEFAADREDFKAWLQAELNGGVVLPAILKAAIREGIA